MPPPAWLILAFLLLLLLLLHRSPTSVALPICIDYDQDDCFGIGSDNQDSDSQEEGHFNYESNERWQDEYPSCGGLRQSPINIEINDIQKVTLDGMPLRALGYDKKPRVMWIENNGHTVLLTAEWLSEKPMLVGGPLLGAYAFEQLHFHWGNNNNYGSEHTVGNESYPLEMHIVHYKTAYHNISNAIKYTDGVVVAAYLFSIDSSMNYGIELIQSKFKDINFPGQKVTLEPFSLNNFGFDVIHKGFIIYKGSLSTPPCNEAVIWLIAVNIQVVTMKEMKKFRQIIMHENDFNNNRPTQNLNGRQILYYLEDMKN